jgi:demethylmenaquinone methyltransferase/2-methoxy-6-polyprenyl-1,4-benzoquinol methylase
MLTACCAPTLPSSRPTSCGCRCERWRGDGVTCGFALRNVVSLEAFFREAARVVRPGGRADAARRERARQRGCSVPATPCTSGGSSADRRAALRRRRLPLPAAVDRRTFPPPDEMLRDAAAGRVPGRGSPSAHGGLTQLLVGTRG